MVEPDTIDTWADYWAHRRSTTGAADLTAAARAPLHTHAFLDVGTLCAAPLDVTITDLRDRPDAVLAAAREGFAQFLADEPELARPADVEYDRLPLHLIGLSPDQRNGLALTDPIEQARQLVTLPGARIVEEPSVSARASTVTYGCPAGHEVAIDQPLYRGRRLETCGEPDCNNDVYVRDTATEARRVVTFDVEYDGRTLRCVGTGRYASRPELVTADAIDVTAIPRLETHPDGTVDPVLDVSNVERNR